MSSTRCQNHRRLLRAVVHDHLENALLAEAGVFAVARVAHAVGEEHEQVVVPRPPDRPRGWWLVDHAQRRVERGEPLRRRRSA